LSRIGLAFSSFFSILFNDMLPEEAAKAYGYVKADLIPTAKPIPTPTAKPAQPKRPEVKISDGALQMLGILQRDSRLVDLLMEDIAGAEDDQIGAAFRNVQEQCRQSLEKYIHLAPVIDGVEGSYTKIQSSDPAQVKLLGNVPANGKAQGGILRHKGWRAERVELPELTSGQKPEVIAPAEIEIE
jgi:hypothetical protein